MNEMNKKTRFFEMKVNKSISKGEKVINECIILKENFLPLLHLILPAGIYMFKGNTRNTRTKCKICSKLTIKTNLVRSGVFIVNFEHISHLVLVFLLLTLNM